MAGPKAAGTVAGAGAISTGDSSWSPTVKFLLILVGAELLAYGALRHFTSHGG